MSLILQSIVVRLTVVFEKPLHFYLQLAVKASNPNKSSWHVLKPFVLSQVET
ncbi:protein of unknown function [Methylotuvimicrobium alcaliphilum 20Z]|uniref:Uncharacterized protein n=1 Tax=Methylotuvimicrobium alcaliphilum (strain DSM 19304 / NCIMB 14124 / VKM B-2133 / 20Z) TaxID=1091494 RepID=G4SX94_META2|nr:protein of unknown function [Methylotuvimicrobium alcaliphilum 20Z]